MGDPGSSLPRQIYRPRSRVLRATVITVVALLLVIVIAATVIGWFEGPTFLHPVRRPLTQSLIHEADQYLAPIRYTREQFDVIANDGTPLRGWAIAPANANGNWLLLFHGVSDNRAGMIGPARILLEAGYSVVMMDSRAHGESGGAIATYGWLERNDAHAVVSALETSKHPKHIFALGESMGGGIALQTAAADPRIEAVIAESPFASLHEAAYDYAGLHKSILLGKTLFASGALAMLYHGQRISGLPASRISAEAAVAQRAFPILLICDEADMILPCRHAERIFNAAVGPKELWRVPGAYHTGALGVEPQEFRRRILAFLAPLAASPSR